MSAATYCWADTVGSQFILVSSKSHSMGACILYSPSQHSK